MRKVSAKNIQWLNKELSIMESAGVLSPDTVHGVKSYYSENTASGMHWAIIAFAILGSLLIGSGIILLFAHNWDELGRPARAALSFCPVIIGALLSVIALVKNGGVALRESAGIFHTIAVGASIALIGQTYHLPSNTPAFLLSWILLTLPLVFLLRSTGAFLIYLGLSWGWSEVAQETYGHAAGFWLLILPAIGKLVAMIRRNRHSPDTLVSFFGVLFTLCMSLGFVFERTIPGLWIIAYSTLLSCAGLVGIHYYKGCEGWSNPAKTFGLIGIGVLAYLFTWTHFWDEIGWSYHRSGWNYRPWGGWMDGLITFALLAGWAAAAVKAFCRDSMETILLAAFPILGIIGFILAAAHSELEMVNALLFNGFLLVFGILYIVLGCRGAKLRQLNGGMAVLSLLLVTRFFDDEFGFMVKGIVFIVLGVVLLSVNLVMAKKKKQLETAS